VEEKPMRIPIIAAAAVLAASSLTLAEMPSGYPRDCATVDRCAPVSGVSWSAQFGSAPQLLIASRFGNAVMQRSLTIEASRDGRAHVCMRYDPFGDLEVTCLLVPVHAPE
jgi:hypothetical protein